MDVEGSTPPSLDGIRTVGQERARVGKLSPGRDDRDRMPGGGLGDPGARRERDGVGDDNYAFRSTPRYCSEGTVQVFRLPHLDGL